MADALSVITPVNDNFRMDVELSDPTLTDPTEADALQQGEWLMPSTTQNKWERADGTDARSAAAAQVFTQAGDLASQAIGKVAVLLLHEYEAETTMFLDTLSGALAIGSPLTTAVGTIGGVAGRSGLDLAGTGDHVIGIVTRLPADNGNKLRFRKVSGNTVPLA